MRYRLLRWLTLGMAPIWGALACSGKTVHEVGDVNSPQSGGAAGADIGNAGAQTNPNEGGSGGSDGGSGGTDGIDDADAGAGNDIGAPFDCPTCFVLTGDQDVRAVFVVSDQVYWLDYGKSDKLGNYSYDGHLFVRNVAGGEPRLIAGGLPGPKQLSVNGDYAYVVVDRRTQPNFAGGVLRIATAGGTTEEISTSSDLAFVESAALSAATGYEYWVLDGGIARAANSANAVQEAVLAQRGVDMLASDGGTLFFRDAGGIWSMPVDGEPVQLSANEDYPYLGLAVSGPYLYTLENGSRQSLIRMPKTGGTWTRLATYAPHLSQLAVEGDRVFVGGYPGDFQLFQAKLSAPGIISWLLTYNSSRFWPWAVSDGGVFFGNNHALYFTSGVP